MKLITFILCICCVCISYSKVVTSTERFGKTVCRVKVNPIKGLISNGACEVNEIMFYDADGMWLGTYTPDRPLEPYYSYRNVWLNYISYIEDTYSIIATFNYSGDDYVVTQPKKDQEVIFQPYGSPYPDGNRLPKHCWGNPKAKYWCSWRGGIPSK